MLLGSDDTQKWSLRAGGMAPVVECLPSSGEALSSIPNTTKKKKKLKTESYA
jgi:hypothetical protein